MNAVERQKPFNMPSKYQNRVIGIEDDIDPVAITRVANIAARFGVNLSRRDIEFFSRLSTPHLIQEYLNTLRPNLEKDASGISKPTAFPPKAIRHQGKAHCFEGAMFATAALFLHGISSRIVLLQASKDEDHNVCLHRDLNTGYLGCIARAGGKLLQGRPAQFMDIASLVATYGPAYNDSEKDFLFGYSEPIDIINKFGTAWIGNDRKQLWNIYFYYITHRVKFYSLTDPSKTYVYPQIQALQEGWITRDRHGIYRINRAGIPLNVQVVYNEYNRAAILANHNSEDRDSLWYEARFRELTGIAPSDLDDAVYDLNDMREMGYVPEKLIK
ncbi:MAG: hypothetical protein AAB874_01020 [Patescibacteria group bacterium]